MQTKSEAFFLPVDDDRKGQRFGLFHPAQGATTRGAILYIHPFAEEMNKSRRMAALQSRALSQAGFSVLQMDLLGCGDSSGDFADATWKDWVADVVQGWHWLAARSKPRAGNSNTPPQWFWGLRAGCLLAVEASRQLNADCNFLFWQPPASGKPLLQQFLRLKVAGDMLGGESKGAMDRLRQQLAAGSAVEIAGYMLSAELASDLEQSALTPPASDGRARRLEWFEMSTRDDATLSPVSRKAFAQWQQSGFAAANHVVNGPAFWQTSEIESAPELITATTAALCATAPSAMPEVVAA